MIQGSQNEVVNSCFMSGHLFSREVKFLRKKKFKRRWKQFKISSDSLYKQIKSSNCEVKRDQQALILSFKRNPQIGSDTVCTTEVKSKMIFFICQRVWKTVKCLGKVREF